jgi:fumarate reductase (CoM/CoB) subunit A
MKTTPREISTDVLVVGSGAAALRAMLEASSAGADVLVVIKGEFRKSGATFHSLAEVGAFNVPDNSGGDGDTPDVFVADILKAAQGMSDPALGRILAEEAEDALRYLEGFGVPFEKKEDGYLVFQACFSTRARSHVIQDHFKPIVRALGTEASRRGIKVLDNLMIVDLIVRGGVCVGAYGLDGEGEPVVIRAKATIFTTGGASQLFATNLYPSDITGDGYAMAHRAGAQLANMEFMQAGISLIHPFVNLFGNYLWDGHPNLTDRDAKPFLADYLPDGLTPHSVIDEKQRHFPFSSSDISRYIEISVQKAINEGRGAEEGGVYLDFLDTDFERLLSDESRSFARMWKLTYAWYQARGVDLYKEKVQIACSAHAINGGILIDGDAQSSLPGLYAAGEVAAGPHGADRLGGNMSVTCQVFGATHPEMDDAGDYFTDLQGAYKKDGAQSVASIRSELQKLANRHLLVIRTQSGLETISDGMTALREALHGDAAIETPADLRAAAELDNMLDVGGFIATAASLRTESRGSHYREDYPAADDGQNTSIILDRNASGGHFRLSLASR